MFRQSIYFAILFCTLGCVSAKHAKNLFVNKILVYKEDFDTNSLEKGMSNFNSSFAAYDGKTIVQVEYPYGLLEKSFTGYTVSVNGSGDSMGTPVYSYAPLPSNPPYSFEKEGNKIFIAYFKANRRERQLYYSLKVNDSVNIFEIRHICSQWPMNKGISVYTGKDTTFIFNTIKLKCWIFAEYYKRYDGLGMKNKKCLVYLDKQNLLPIMRSEQNFEGPDFSTSAQLPVISQLNFLLAYDASKFKVFKCD